MELKFIFSIIVLLQLHLRICVSGSSVDVEHCMAIAYDYPEEAKNFAEEDATQEDLELAIASITKAFRNSDSDNSSMRDFDWAEDESRITSDLTKCYEIRKVKSF